MVRKRYIIQVMKLSDKLVNFWNLKYFTHKVLLKYKVFLSFDTNCQLFSFHERSKFVLSI